MNGECSVSFNLLVIVYAEFGKPDEISSFHVRGCSTFCEKAPARVEGRAHGLPGMLFALTRSHALLSGLLKLHDFPVNFA